MKKNEEQSQKPNRDSKTISQDIHDCLEKESLDMLAKLKMYSGYFVLRQEITGGTDKKTHTLKIMKEDKIKNYVDQWHKESFEYNQNSIYHLEPLLHTIVKKNWVEGVKLLLADEHINVNTWSYISTPASNKDSSDSAISRGNLQKNQTALHIAVNNAHEELVMLLLNKGAHTNVAGRQGTPLVRCCLNPQENKNRLTIAKKLIEKNANLNATQNEELSPLKAALEQEKLNQDIIVLLLNDSKLNMPELDNVSDFTNDLLERRQYNEKLLPILEKIANQVEHSFKKHHLTSIKEEIWSDFLNFFKSHMTYKPRMMIEEWVKQYGAKHNNENPFSYLKLHRRTGICGLFNPKFTRSIKAFKEYLKNETMPECMTSSKASLEDESLPLLQPN